MTGEIAEDWYTDFIESGEGGTTYALRGFTPFPHLFSLLDWWEERDVKDMPEYVKLVMYGKNQFVHKVEKWVGVNDNGTPLYEYKNRVNYQTQFSVTDLDPATEQEYLNYIQQQSIPQP